METPSTSDVEEIMRELPYFKPFTDQREGLFLNVLLDRILCHLPLLHRLEEKEISLLIPQLSLQPQPLHHWHHLMLQLLSLIQVAIVASRVIIIKMNKTIPLLPLE